MINGKTQPFASNWASQNVVILVQKIAHQYNSKQNEASEHKSFTFWGPETTQHSPYPTLSGLITSQSTSLWLIQEKPANSNNIHDVLTIVSS